MAQNYDREDLRQRAWSFNAALFLLVMYGVSGLVACWQGDWVRAIELGGGSTILTLLIGFSKYHNPPVQRLGTKQEESIGELPECVDSSDDQSL
jgi:hypothetical protein